MNWSKAVHSKTKTQHWRTFSTKKDWNCLPNGDLHIFYRRILSYERANDKAHNLPIRQDYATHDTENVTAFYLAG